MWQRIKDRLLWILAAAVAVLTSLVAALSRRPKAVPVPVESTEQAREAAKKAEAVLEQEKQAAAGRQRKANELADRLGKLPKKLPAIVGLAILCGGLLLAPVTRAAEPTIPKDYDQLVQLYLEAVDIASQYKALYEQAEASNQRLMAQAEALQKQVQELTSIVERQNRLILEMQQAILKLLKGLSLSVGATASQPVTLFVAVSYRF